MSEEKSFMEKTGIFYGFKWNPNPPITLAQWVTFAGSIGVVAVLVMFANVAVPFAAIGVSTVYLAIGFIIPFGLWFGLWGIILCGYLAVFLGGSLGGTPMSSGVLTAWADVIQVIIPFIAYRWLAPKLGLDPLGRDFFTKGKWWKAWLFMYVFAVFPNNWLAATYNMNVLYWMGLVPQDVIKPAVIGWVLGDVWVISLIMPVLCYFVSPIVERAGLTVRGWVS